MGSTQKDMQLSEQRKFTKEEILMMYGISESMFGKTEAL